MRFTANASPSLRTFCGLFLVLAVVLTSCTNDAGDTTADGPPLLRSTPTPGTPPDPDLGPTLADHWHKGFGIYVCNTWLPNPQSEFDPEGIHSHQDGILHIHPFNRKVTGNGATLSWLMDALFMELTDTSLDISGGQFVSSSTTTCAAGPGVMVVAMWDGPPETVPTGEPDRIITENLTQTLLDSDGGALAIAFVSEGTTIPVPPSSKRLANLDAPVESPPGPVDVLAPSRTDKTQFPPGDTPTKVITLGPDGSIEIRDGDGVPIEDLLTIPMDDIVYEELPPPELLIQPVQSVMQTESSPFACIPGAFDPDICFVLSARPALDRSGIASATASRGPDADADWQINLVLTPAGLEKFNKIATECFRRRALCPSGQVAFRSNGDFSFDVVFSAPTVNAERFDADQVVIYGNFEQSTAENVAETINEAIENGQ